MVAEDPFKKKKFHLEVLVNHLVLLGLPDHYQDLKQRSQPQQIKSKLLEVDQRHCQKYYEILAKGVQYPIIVTKVVVTRPDIRDVIVVFQVTKEY
jgi:hypothetical protein